MKNKILAAVLMALFSADLYGAADDPRNTSSDVVNSTVFATRLLDGCGDDIPTDRGSLYRCWNETGGAEPFPVNASEMCAYDGINDDVELAFDRITTSEVPTKYYLEASENLGDRYDIEVGQLLSRREIAINSDEDAVAWLRENGRWNGPAENGGLGVGRQGKNYLLQVKQENQTGVVISTTGYINVFVDDCVGRQDQIKSLLTDDSVFKTDGFELYLEVLDETARSICATIEYGVKSYSDSDFDPSRTFDQRCRYQCINNHFTNVLYDLAREGLSGKNVLRTAHDKASAYSALANSLPITFYTTPGVQAAQAETIKRMVTFLFYVDMEDYLRADGYLACGGPLNYADSEHSIKIIRQSINDVVIPFFGGVADQFLGIVQDHLDITKAIYEDLRKEQDR